MIRFRSILLGVLSLALTMVAQPLSAQVCLGTPLSSGATTVAVGAQFPDNANTYGVGVIHQATQNVNLGASYALTSFSGILDGMPSMHSVGGRAAFEVPMNTNAGGPALSICPNAGAEYGRWEDMNIVSVPVGVGVGVAFPLADNFAMIAPYANPQYVWTRMSLDGESDSTSDFGFTLGANLVVGNLLFGPTFAKLGDSDGMFGIRAGFIF